MNMFLHGIEDFHIARGDTLTSPAFIEHDELKTFNVILANPPYSIKRWNRKMFENDPYGRNMFGTPTQGCADYAFEQHIIKSLDKNNGRSVVLWPHGILFRDQEMKIRKKLIEADLIEAVIGLGPNLFYNSPMESCLLICKTKKRPNQKGKILFINAVNEVKRENSTSYLTLEQIQKIFTTYLDYLNNDGFSIVINNKKIEENNWNLSISLYIRPISNSIRKTSTDSIENTILDWQTKSVELKKNLQEILNIE
jgi:type I restriction enzyme M protein